MISVIVPVYNVERVLHYCINSILKQTYQDFELILVDDGSTDKSGELCDRYAQAHGNVTAIHTKNQGVSKARNTGIELAKGEFICFIDSDDYIEKDFLSELMVTKNAFPDFDNVWCCFQTVDGYCGDKLQDNLIKSDHKTHFEYTISEIMTLHDNWLDAGPVCKLYLRETIVNNNLRFDETKSFGEDLLFNFGYLDKTNGKIVVLNKVLYNYVEVGNTSLSKKFYPNLFDIYKQNNNQLAHYILKWNCDDGQQKRFYNSCFYSYENVLRNTFHENSNIKYKHRFNHHVLKSHEFVEAIQKLDCFIHPFYRFAYKCKSSRLVRGLDLLLTLKKR